MNRTTPPFRADQVGSFLRTKPLQEARAKHARKEITAAQLAAVEDREITAIVRKQEEVGMKLATDGEFRRAMWHYDFYQGLKGVRLSSGESIHFKGVGGPAKVLSITGKIDFPADHPFLAHFKFLKATTKVVPKMTIPSPTVLHYRLEPNAVSKDAYSSLDAACDDLAAAYRKAIRAFYDAGCRYLQLDDTAWAYLCSKDEMRKTKERGIDADHLLDTYSRMVSGSIADKPADMVITTHVCRGNFRSKWFSEGGYEPIAERLFGDIGFDGYFLEYDTARAGGFEPLRFLPKGKKIVVVGLITSKSGTLEAKDDIKRRLDEAAKFAPLQQLALSPQCGFASVEEGNVLTEEQQWAKLREVVELADEVWGK